MHTPSFYHAFQGAQVADALAMPAHWYYNRDALQDDYGPVDHFQAPRNPHPDSILWRSTYEPLNEEADILREQAQYWGRKGIHYHQFLQAGENTLNFKLAAELVRWVEAREGYDPDAWLERYVEVMRTEGWHQDTYVEEVHRGFFTKRAQGKALRKCAIRDEHIGGLALVPALCHVLEDASLEALRRAVKEHVGLTHKHANVLRAADTLTRILWHLRDGVSLEEVLQKQAGDWISLKKAERWLSQPDTHVIGERFSPACYIGEAMPASLYLAWKYAGNFSRAIQANAEVGGDNCHRGAVIGSIVGMLAPFHVDLWVRQQETLVTEAHDGPRSPMPPVGP